MFKNSWFTIVYIKTYNMSDDHNQNRGRQCRLCSARSTSVNFCSDVVRCIIIEAIFLLVRSFITSFLALSALLLRGHYVLCRLLSSGWLNAGSWWPPLPSHTRSPLRKQRLLTYAMTKRELDCAHEGAPMPSESKKRPRHNMPGSSKEQI